MPVKANLLSIPTLVESPFIIVTIAGHTFGSYSVTGGAGNARVQYPDYMKSLSATKVNGAVNTYTIRLSYQVGYGEDPNLIDKILSKASKTRTISIQYGDWNAPSYIYKEDVAIITKVTTSLNMQQSSIEYTIECTGDAVAAAALSYDFPARVAKPSDVLKSMLLSSKYGLQSVFKGMRNSNKVLSEGLIASSDKPVQLEAKLSTTPIAYMNYLVQCMTPADTEKKSSYMLSIHEDYDDHFGGTYMRVTEVTTPAPSYISVDTYQVDINYPEDNLVSQFSLNDDQSWAILYDFADQVKQEEWVYKIDDEGNLVTEYAPTQHRKKRKKSESQSKTNWWLKMTQFPVSATLVIKGLTRPTLLMSYVKLNVWFHGASKHISSGLYIITKQVDSVDSTGYKTTLSLLRVGGDV